VTTEKYSFKLEDFFQTTVLRGYAVAQLVEALCYKLAGHGFDSQWGPYDFKLTLGSTQPLTEMNTRGISWGIKAVECIRLTTLPPSFANCIAILGASTSWSAMGLSSPVQA
jgi:hypothetical protein